MMRTEPYWSNRVCSLKKSGLVPNQYHWTSVASTPLWVKTWYTLRASSLATRFLAIWVVRSRNPHADSAADTEICRGLADHQDWSRWIFPLCDRHCSPRTFFFESCGVWFAWDRVYPLVSIGQDQFDAISMKQIGDPIPSICGFHNGFVCVSDRSEVIDYLFRIIEYFLLFDYFLFIWILGFP